MVYLNPDANPNSNSLPNLAAPKRPLPKGVEFYKGEIPQAKNPLDCSGSFNEYERLVTIGNNIAATAAGAPIDPGRSKRNIMTNLPHTVEHVFETDDSSVEGINRGKNTVHIHYNDNTAGLQLPSSTEFAHNRVAYITTRPTQGENEINSLLVGSSGGCPADGEMFFVNPETGHQIKVDLNKMDRETADVTIQTVISNPSEYEGSDQ